MVKKLPASAGDTSQEDHLEEERAICSSILAWKIPYNTSEYILYFIIF